MDVKEICGFCVYIRFHARKTIENVQVYYLFAPLSAPAAAAAKSQVLSALKVAFDQSIKGFENAYRLTFFAALGALIIGAFLPGWPGKWSGRGSMQGAAPGGH